MPLQRPNNAARGEGWRVPSSISALAWAVLHGPPEKAPAAAAALAELVLIEDKTVDVVARESRICVCGHLAHWHSHSGEGDCEHDGDCRCEAFTSSPKLGEAPSR